MPLLPLIKGTIRALTRKEELDRELDDELRAYLELVVEEKIEGGLEPDQARREAMIELGGIEQVKATARSARHGAALDVFLQDVRYAARKIRRSPGFAAVVVITLALGIGANTALFSTINAVLVRQLPLDEPDRLVAGTKTIHGRPAGPVSRLDYYDYRESSDSLEGLGAYLAGRVTVTGEPGAEIVSVMVVTSDLLPVLGVQPMMGRHFLLEEETTGGESVALISYSLWQRRFAGDPEVLGRSVHFSGTSRTIVGVMPRGFRFMAEADLWLLVVKVGDVIDPQRDSHSLRLVGRLKPGVSLEQAQREMDAISASLAELYPDTNGGKKLVLRDLHDAMVGTARDSLHLLMAMTGLVLLIACLNVAGLLLARGQDRMSEMAMRSALGAPRWRLVRQLVTESSLLTLVAGMVGVAAAVPFQKLLLQVLPLGRPGLPEPAIDPSALLFALVASTVSGVLVGVMPAFRVTAFTPWLHLKAATRVSEGSATSRTRSTMVVSQVAFSLVLVICLSLLARSMARLVSVELGFDPEQVVAGVIAVPEAEYSTPEMRNQFFSSLIDEVEALPGVDGAATVSKLPIASRATDWPIWHADEPRPSSDEYQLAMARWASATYFDAIGIPLLAGRGIDDTDTRDSRLVLVISEGVAEGLFPGKDPIGSMVKLGWTDDVYEIVGIVGDARINGVSREADWAMYMSAAQMATRVQWLVVKAKGDPGLLLEPLRETIRAKDPDIVFASASTMTDIVDDDLQGLRSVMVALGVLTAVALLLTSVGLYGVLAYHVSQRACEFGIRRAIGASAFTLLRTVIQRGLRMVGLGLVLGFAGSILGARLIGQLLYETGPFDPLAHVRAAAFLGAVALLSCLLPAWRATRIDPVKVLRRE